LAPPKSTNFVASGSEHETSSQLLGAHRHLNTLSTLTPSFISSPRENFLNHRFLEQILADCVLLVAADFMLREYRPI
jgi:hypothetical protein